MRCRHFVEVAIEHDFGVINITVANADQLVVRFPEKLILLGDAQVALGVGFNDKVVAQLNGCSRCGCCGNLGDHLIRKEDLIILKYLTNLKHTMEKIEATLHEICRQATTPSQIQADIAKIRQLDAQTQSNQTPTLNLRSRAQVGI